MIIPTSALLALVPFFLQGNAQASGSGKSTRYWDCCKASCAWEKKVALASGARPVDTCDRNDNVLTNLATKSGCDGGTAFMCTNQSPWAASTSLAYGFAAVSISGGNESTWCCACYEITFTTGPVAGKKMIVQATNTGGDLGTNHFDLAMPGGGFGIFDGCTSEWGTPSTGWGNRYGGVTSRSQCDAFPQKLKAGCYWRFDWFLNADNPDLTFKQITCPKVLTDKTGCIRNGENPTTGNPTTASTKTTAKTTTTLSKTTAKTTAPGATTTKATTSAAAGGGTVPLYGQCGGIGWTGGTKCASGTCKYSNDWYSQCL